MQPCEQTGKKHAFLSCLVGGWVRSEGLGFCRCTSWVEIPPPPPVLCAPVSVPPGLGTLASQQDHLGIQ